MTAVLWMTLLIACGSPVEDSGAGADARRCNGLAELCDRPLDEVVFAMTHNAMSSEDWGLLPPNQGHGIEQQLRDGVRGFMLDVHLQDDEAWLCHGDCRLGGVPLADGMVAFADFIDDNPDEVLVFMLESYVSPALVAESFAAAGLDGRAVAQAPGAPWPTLAALLDAGTPLAVFSQGSGEDIPWLLDGYTDFVWDTPYGADSPEELSCEVLRGSADHSIFLVNHFLTNPIALPSLAEEINHDPFLSEWLDDCADQVGQPVDWVAVDFYEIGDTLAAVERLNRTGRATP